MVGKEGRRADGGEGGSEDGLIKIGTLAGMRSVTPIFASAESMR